MASEPSQIVADRNADQTVEQAIFALSKPIKEALNDSEIDIHGLGMRALDTPDLPLLDQFQGQPVALAQNVVAALCDITVEQVRQLDLTDFTMLANDALWQVEQLSIAMGLPPRFFLQPQAKEAEG